MDNDKLLSEAEKLIKKGKPDEAQAILENIAEHGARWHFVQSEIYYGKNWLNECKKHLERAIELDPENADYKAVYEQVTAYAQPDEVFTNPYSKKQMGNKNCFGACAEGCCECGAMCACEGLCEAICNGF